MHIVNVEQLRAAKRGVTLEGDQDSFGVVGSFARGKQDQCSRALREIISDEREVFDAKLRTRRNWLGGKLSHQTRKRESIFCVGEIADPYARPCGHVFGHGCISAHSNIPRSAMAKSYNLARSLPFIAAIELKRSMIGAD